MSIQIDTADLEDRIVQRLQKSFSSMLARHGKDNGDNEPLFTVDSLAEYLGVKKSWVYEKVEKRELPYYKPGKHLRFKRSEIDAWLNKCKTPAFNPLTDIPPKITRSRKKA